MATINALASRLSGVAPLSVFFDTIGTAGVTQPPLVADRREYADFDYTWDFDDPTSGTWVESGKSKDADNGYVAAHVFETPGTYVVTVAIIDGDTVNESHNVTITVTDPDTFYSGTNTTCVSSTGVFTGCPVGATQVTSSNFDGSINTYKGNSQRILFRRGDSWNSATSMVLSNTTSMTIGAYGTGTSPDGRGIFSNAPLVNATGDDTVAPLFVNNSITNNRITDLRFVNIGTRGDCISGDTDMYEFLMLRNKWEAWDNVAVGNGFFNTTGHDQIALIDNDISDSDTNNVFLGSERLAILGNRIVDPRLSHVMRVWHSYKGVIKHNESSGASSQSTNGRLALKLHGPAEHEVLENGGSLEYRTQYTVVADNLFGESAPDPMVIGPTNADEDERVKDIVVENNRFYSGYGTKGLFETDVQVSLTIWASYVTARNNVMAGEGSHKSYFGVAVSRRGIEPVPTGNRIYNNTIYKSEEPVGNDLYVGVVVSPDAVDTIVKNNLAHFNSNVVQRGAVSDNGTNTIQSNNLMTDESLLVDPENIVYLDKDFRPTENSPSVGGGTDVPIFKDFDDNTRAIATIDVGAFEYAGTDVTAPTLSSPTGIATGSTTAKGAVSTNQGNGTLYFIATENATELEAAIRAGSSQTVSATGTQTIDFTGLTAETTYYPHYVQEDPATNVSNVISGASFTTLEKGMINLFTDLFDRANEALGASADWTVRQGNYEIVGNEATLGTVGGTERCAHIDSAYISTGPDYSVVANVEIATTGFLYHGVCGRRVDFSTDDSDMYVLAYSADGGLQLFSRVSGAWTPLDTYATTLSGTTVYKFELKMTGSTIEGYLDDVLRVSKIDTSLTASGDAGLQNGTDTSIATGRVWLDFYVNTTDIAAPGSPIYGKDGMTSGSPVYGSGGIESGSKVYTP